MIYILQIVFLDDTKYIHLGYLDNFLYLLKYSLQMFLEYYSYQAPTSFILFDFFELPINIIIPPIILIVVGINIPSNTTLFISKPNKYVYTIKTTNDLI